MCFAIPLIRPKKNICVWGNMAKKKCFLLLLVIGPWQARAPAWCTLKRMLMQIFHVWGLVQEICKSWEVRIYYFFFKRKHFYINYSTKETHIWLPWHIILILGIATHNYLVPNCFAINLEYITRNMVKIKQLCLSIGSARYTWYRGGMVPKVALSYHWITLVKTLILDYTLILLPQYINNGWDHHRQQYILHSAHLRRHDVDQTLNMVLW